MNDLLDWFLARIIPITLVIFAVLDSWKNNGVSNLSLWFLILSMTGFIIEEIKAKK